MQVKLVRKKLIMRKDIVHSFRNVFPLKIHKLSGADLFLSNKMNKLIILLVWGRIGVIDGSPNFVKMNFFASAKLSARRV